MSLSRNVVEEVLSFLLNSAIFVYYRILGSLNQSLVGLYNVCLLKSLYNGEYH